LVSTTDFAGAVPFLSITPVGPLLHFLRGVDTTGSNVNQGQSVATYVDESLAIGDRSV
jgi:hypothetical protein